jgi:hypothetical protein
MKDRFILTIDGNGKLSTKLPEGTTPKQFEKIARISVALEPSWVLSFFLRIEVFFFRLTCVWEKVKNEVRERDK